MIKIVHGEAVVATCTDLWASGLGQVDTRSSTRAKNPRHQVG